MKLYFIGLGTDPVFVVPQFGFPAPYLPTDEKALIAGMAWSYHPRKGVRNGDFQAECDIPGGRWPV